MRAKMLALLALLLGAIAPARPAASADLALVLLTDVSSSMDDGEYQMVKAGYRAAFSDPEVIAALLGNPGGVAVAYVEFSGADQITLVKGWDVLTDAASARAFGEAVAEAPRSASGNTALAAGIRWATRLLGDGRFGEARQVVDVASDHPTDGGRSASARDAAVAAGITVNAIPIMDDRPIGTFDGHTSYSKMQSGIGGMAAFYRRDVIGGPGCFMEEARNYSAFGDSLKRKLLLEIAGGRTGPRLRTPLLTAAAAP